MRTTLVVTLDKDVMAYLGKNNIDPSALINRVLRKEMQRLDFRPNPQPSTDAEKELETLLDQDTAAAD